MTGGLTEAQLHILAVLAALLYLVFDAARYFHHNVSAVRLRQWSGTDPEFREGSRWFQYDKDHFSLVSGALLQVALAGGVVLTAAGFAKRGLLVAGVLTLLIWVTLTVVWKFAIALAPEEFAESCVHALIPVSHAFYYVFFPLLFPLGILLRAVNKREEEGLDEPTEEEVRAYIDVGEEEGILEEGEGKLLQSIVDFGDRIAREVMTPRVQIVAIEVDEKVDALAQLINRTKYSRIPVYERAIDNVIGIVHIKDLFGVFVRGDKAGIREIASPPYFVSETKRVSELLREFQIEHLQLAIVVDEFGGTAGLVTIEDLLEEIVGEIADEHEGDEESLFLEIEAGTYLVSGRLKVEALDELTGTSLDTEENEYDTIAGLVIKELGRIPRVGEQVSRGGLIFRVERADRKRVYRVRVTRDPQWNQESAEVEE